MQALFWAEVFILSLLSDWVRCINQPFIEVFKNHTSRKLLRFIRLLTNHCTDRVVTAYPETSIQKLQQWFNKASVQDVAKLPELLQERGMKNLAAKIEHRFNRIQDEVNLCKNTLNAWFHFTISPSKSLFLNVHILFCCTYVFMSRIVQTWWS